MIKYLLALAGGFVSGMVIIAIMVFYNPMVKSNILSPLSVSENQVVRLSYSVAAEDTLLYTNNGESRIDPNPAKVLQLWEPTIVSTTATVNLLEDSRGRPAGIGVKFSSHSDKTNILNGKALANSVWHIYLPERGSVFIEQSENYWGYIQDIVVPAHRSSGDNWRGTWLNNISDGPGALGTGLVAGGSGEFAGIDSIAVESLSAKAYSVDLGPVAMTGELSIEIPPAAVTPVEDQQLSQGQ